MNKKLSSSNREILKRWVELQEKRYGPDWRSKLAAEMAVASKPFVEAFMKLVRKGNDESGANRER